MYIKVKRLLYSSPISVEWLWALGLVFKIVYECVLCPDNMPELANNKVRKGLLLFGMYIEGQTIQNLGESPVYFELQYASDFQSSN